MMKIVLFTLVSAALLVGIAVLILGIKVFFVKNGKFPSGHVHDQPQLRRRGIGCAHGPEHH